jgi:hypothetical protein
MFPIRIPEFFKVLDCQFAAPPAASSLAWPLFIVLESPLFSGGQIYRTLPSVYFVARRKGPSVDNNYNECERT